MTEPLIHTPVGELCHGDRFYFRRSTRLGRDQCGWVTARSVGESWVNGVDDRGRARAIRLEEITRIKRNHADRRLSARSTRA